MSFLRHNSVSACVALVALALQMAFGFGHVHTHHTPNAVKQTSLAASLGLKRLGLEHDQHGHDQHGHEQGTPVEHDGDREEHECPTCWTLASLTALAAHATVIDHTSPRPAREIASRHNDRRVQSTPGRNFRARAPPVMASHAI